MRGINCDTTTSDSDTRRTSSHYGCPSLAHHFGDRDIQDAHLAVSSGGEGGSHLCIASAYLCAFRSRGGTGNQGQGMFVALVCISVMHAKVMMNDVCPRLRRELARIASI
jgi:hypothetical protein